MPNHPPLFFNGTPVNNVKEHKHLGLILDSKLSYDKHVIEKKIKVKKGIRIIKQLDTKCCTLYLRVVYFPNQIIITTNSMNCVRKIVLQ